MTFKSVRTGIPGGGCGDGRQGLKEPRPSSCWAHPRGLQGHTGSLGAGQPRGWGSRGRQTQGSRPGRPALAQVLCCSMAPLLWPPPWRGAGAVQLAPPTAGHVGLALAVPGLSPGRSPVVPHEVPMRFPLGFSKQFPLRLPLWAPPPPRLPARLPRPCTALPASAPAPLARLPAALWQRQGRGHQPKGAGANPSG